MVPCRWSNSPRKRREKTLCLPCNHCSFIVCCGAGTQIRSQPGFSRAAALPSCLCCEGTRSSQWLPGSPLKALCRQVFANRSLNSLCLKWHGLSRGSEWGFDLSLARHEKKKKWLHLKFPTASVTANNYTCTSAPPISQQVLTTTRPLVAQVQRRLSQSWHIFSPLCLAASACWENGSKMTPTINSYALDLVIYCSARRRSGGVFAITGISSLWRVTSKNVSNDHNAAARLWETHVEIIYRHKQCNSDERRPGLLLPPARGGSANEAENLERRGRVIATGTSRFMFLHVGGPALSLWAARVLWAQIWCFGWCLGGAV